MEKKSKSEQLKRQAREVMERAAKQSDPDYAWVDQLVAEDLARRAEEERKKGR